MAARSRQRKENDPGADRGETNARSSLSSSPVADCRSCLNNKGIVWRRPRGVRPSLWVPGLGGNLSRAAPTHQNACVLVG